MNAGDEGQQHLEAQPGSTPVLLTSLGGIPLAVGQRYTRAGTQLSLQEASDDLPAFTEAYDKQQKKIASQQRAIQKKADRKARQAQLERDKEAITGMSGQDFDNLSDKEQVEILMQEGNMEALMAAAMKQMEGAQANMSPEQQAQMQAQMAQVQQMMQGASTAIPAAEKNGATGPGQSPVASQQAEEKPASLTVDSMMRGHLQYKHTSGQAVSVSVINRQNDEELLIKEFANGVIDEYLSLRRYQLPLEQIGILIKDDSGATLEDLTPSSQ